MILKETRAVGVGDEKVFTIGFRAHAGHFFGVFGIATAAVDDDHERQAGLSVESWRRVDEEGAGAAIHPDRAVMMTGGSGEVRKHAMRAGERYAGDKQQREK